MLQQLQDSMFAPDGRVTVPPTGSGALDGVRVAVKDLFDIAGRVTAAGNPTLAQGAPAPRSAAAVESLLDAGATVVGKTATDELAMGMFGVNTHYGTPPNPAAPDRVPGGSSSGSASAVAADLADIGLGTDTGGSVRVPGSFCGLLGLRPTHGRIELAGVRPMAPRFDTVGLLARDLDVLTAAFGALTPAGPRRSISKLVLLTDLTDAAQRDVTTLTRATARRWAEGLELELIEAPLLAEPAPADATAVFWPLMSSELWKTNGAWMTEEEPVLGEGIAERIRAAGDVTAAELDVAEAGRARLTDRLGDLLADAVAVLPTTMNAPPRRDLPYEALMAYRNRNLAYVVPASLTGAPQLTVPQGTVVDPAVGTAAPVGISLLGLPGDDELLLALAAVAS